MRCAVVSAVFPPEPVVSASTSHDIAAGLAQRGHEVTVLAPFPSRPTGRVYPGFRRGLFRRGDSGRGFRLVHCFATVSRSSTITSRAAENLSFGLTAALALLRMPRPDVIYSNTWPILATGLLMVVAKLRRVPVVISVQDVYPEGLVSQGRLSASSPVVRSLRSIDSRIARSAAQLVVISRNFHSLYELDRGVPARRLHLVYNWGEDRPPAGADRLAEYRRSRGWTPPDRVVTFAGNIGVAAGVEDVIDALALIPPAQRPILLLAGEGSRLEACRRRAARVGDLRIAYHAPYRPEDNPLVLGGSDVLVLPTRHAQSTFSIPSKLISYLLSARPVVAAALPGSDLAEVVAGAGCGWVVPPDRPDLLAGKVQEACSLPARELDSLGRKGRAWALEHVTRDACLPRVLDLIESTGRGGCRRSKGGTSRDNTVGSHSEEVLPGAG